MTATATNLMTGDTSEFSACQTAAAATTPQSGPAYVVNDAADTDDGVCEELAGGGDCTLREVISAADADGVASTVTFDLPLHSSILLSSWLPEPSTEIVFDATAVGGGACAPAINIDGHVSPVQGRRP